MKISYITLLVLFLGAFGVYSQSTSPELISSSGDYFEFNGGSLSWSLGEGVTEPVMNQNVHLSQGFQQAWNPSVISSQILNLPLGWSIFSTYIDPINNNIDIVLLPIVNHIIIVKNGDGEVYWPNYGVNQINAMGIAEGYQINTSALTSVEILGDQIQPELTPIQLPFGWSIIGYLRQSAADISAMTSSITNNITIIKDENGFVYWPQYGINLIGDMLPGKGFLIRVNSAVTLTYPSNGLIAKSNSYFNTPTSFYRPLYNSDNNMTLGMPTTSWDVEPETGDEIGVYNSDGNLVGATIYNGDMLAIPVWGEDVYNEHSSYLKHGEEFTIKHYHLESDSEETLYVESWIEGDGSYQVNRISIVGFVKHSNEFSLMTDQLSCRNYPNPFKDQTIIEFYLPDTKRVRIEVISLLGEVSQVLEDREFKRGTNKVVFNSGNFSAGTFLYRLSTENASITNYMSIVK